MVGWSIWCFWGRITQEALALGAPELEKTKRKLYKITRKLWNIHENSQKT